MKHLFYTWKLGCLLLLILAGCSSKKVFLPIIPLRVNVWE